MYSNIDVRFGKYGKVHYDQNGNEKYFEPIGNEVLVDRIYENLENEDVILRLSFSFMGKTKYHELPCRDLTDRKFLAELAAKGADVVSKHADLFVESLRLQKDQIGCITRCYHHLGWIEVNDDSGGRQLCYRASKLIGGKKAKYLGNYAMSPQGSFDAWHDMVVQEVLGYTGLEVILLTALSAVVVGLLGGKGTIDNPIIHINYASGKGKSTAAWLATSVSGQAFAGERTTLQKDGSLKKEQSLYGSWGATEKATVTAHCGNQGVVAVLNELGKYVGKDMTSVIFNLSEGSDIKRLDVDLNAHVPEGFHTTFLSCGEMSLVERCKSKLEGIKIRVMEIEEQLTVDADHSRRIKDACNENTGHAAPMLAKYIIDNGGYAMVDQLYRETLADLTETAPEGIPARFIEKFPAIFITTAKLAKKALQLEFNESADTKFCYQCYQNRQIHVGKVDESYHDIIGECTVNEANFYHADYNPNPKILWGSIKHPSQKEKDKGFKVEYGIEASVLDQLLKKHGHTNRNTCISAWKAAGVLNHEQGRNTRERTVNQAGRKDNLYVLRVMVDDNNEDSEG